MLDASAPTITSFFGSELDSCLSARFISVVSATAKVAETLTTDEYVMVLDGRLTLACLDRGHSMKCLRAGDGLILKAGEKVEWLRDRPCQYVSITLLRAASCKPTCQVKSDGGIHSAHNLATEAPPVSTSSSPGAKVLRLPTPVRNLEDFQPDTIGTFLHFRVTPEDAPTPRGAQTAPAGRSQVSAADFFPEEDEAPGEEAAPEVHGTPEAESAGADAGAYASTPSEGVVVSPAVVTSHETPELAGDEANGAGQGWGKGQTGAMRSPPTGKGLDVEGALVAETRRYLERRGGACSLGTLGSQEPIRDLMRRCRFGKLRNFIWAHPDLFEEYWDERDQLAVWLIGWWK